MTDGTEFGDDRWRTLYRGKDEAYSPEETDGELVRIDNEETRLDRLLSDELPFHGSIAGAIGATILFFGIMVAAAGAQVTVEGEYGAGSSPAILTLLVIGVIWLLLTLYLSLSVKSGLAVAALWLLIRGFEGDPIGTAGGVLITLGCIGIFLVKRQRFGNTVGSELNVIVTDTYLREPDRERSFRPGSDTDES